MNEPLLDDMTFRPRSRRRRVLATVTAVAFALVAGMFAAASLTLIPRLGADGPPVVQRSEPRLEDLFPQPPAPKRMTVITALPEGISAGARKVARQTLIVQDAHGNRGSGFMVRPGILVTAAHIADKGDLEKKKLRVRCEPIETDAEVLVADYLRDVLVARVDCVAVPLKIHGAPYRTAPRLYLSGFNFMPDAVAVRYLTPTSALPDEVLTTDVDPIRRRQEKAKILGIPRLQGFDGVVIPGNSGSPVFDDDGVVVGMAVISDGPHRQSFMVPATNILAALEAAHAR